MGEYRVTDSDFWISFIRLSYGLSATLALTSAWVNLVSLVQLPGSSETQPRGIKKLDLAVSFELSAVYKKLL